MSKIVAFPAQRASARPTLPGPLAEIALVPSRLTKSRWLRREALRIAAMVGGASYLNVRRIVLAERIRAGVPDHLARADAEDAVEHVKAMVAALDGWERPPRRSGPDGGRAA